MLLGSSVSKNGVAIHLTQERWYHIIYSHKEIESINHLSLLEVIESPYLIVKGDFGELLAVKRRSRTNKYIVVVYKEINKRNGFVITAYITSNLRWLLKKEIIWNKQS